MIRQSVLLVAMGCILSFASAAHADSFVAHLGTKFTGKGKCLDIVNDQDRNKLVMGSCGNYSGQFWEISTDAANGPARLSNSFSGDGLCLDVVNDGNNDQVTMAQCGNYSGQAWTLWDYEGKPGYIRLTNDFTGEGKCLDIVNDGNNDQLTLADCGNYTGQMWRVAPVK